MPLRCACCDLGRLAQHQGLTGSCLRFFYFAMYMILHSMHCVSWRLDEQCVHLNKEGLTDAVVQHVFSQAFLERHGPYTCLIDGANVAMFGQNWADDETGQKGGFRFDQIEAVMEQIALERPNLKPLLVRGPLTSTLCRSRLP